MTLYRSKSAARQPPKLRDLEVAEPAPEVPDVDAKTRQQLVLHAGREFPVVGAVAPPEARVLIELRNRRQLAEGEARDGRALVVLLQVEEIAVGIEIAAARIADREEEIVPGPRRRRADAGRIPNRRHADDVLPERRFESGLAGAEEVVGDAQARGHVMQAHAGDRRERVVARRLQWRRAAVLFGITAPVAVVADAAGERPAVDRPAILRVEPELPLHQRLAAGRHAVHRELVRHSEVEPEHHVARVGLGRAHRRAQVSLNPTLKECEPVT